MSKFAEPKQRNLLRAAAIAKGFNTQTSFGNAIGMSQNSVHKVFRGWAFPSPQFQAKSAAALGISLKEFRKLL